jgi:hypothetical protein
LDPYGKLKTTFVWSLGKSTNNQARVYTLLWGLLLEIESRIKNLIAIGDSSTIIKLMLSKSPLSHKKIAYILAHIQREV